MISEGRGSLHFFLKARGWASSISAGVGDEGMHRSSIAYVFGMSIHLTDSGLEKVYIFPFFFFFFLVKHWIHGKDKIKLSQKLVAQIKLNCIDNEKYSSMSKSPVVMNPAMYW